MLREHLPILFTGRYLPTARDKPPYLSVKAAEMIGIDGNRELRLLFANLINIGTGFITYGCSS